MSEIVEAEVVEDDPRAHFKAIVERRLGSKARKIILETVQKGRPLTQAAHAAGLSADILTQALTMGQEDPLGPFGNFTKNIRKAQADVEDKVFEQAWRVASESKNPEAWAKLRDSLFEHSRDEKKAVDQPQTVFNVQQMLVNADQRWSKRNELPTGD